MKKRNFLQLLPYIGTGFLFLIILYFGIAEKIAEAKKCGRGSNKQQIEAYKSELILGRRIQYECSGKMSQVTGIILHYTDTKDFYTALTVMEERELFVPIMIDTDGKAYQLTDNIDDFAAGATGGNAWGINIEIVGNGETLQRSAQQKDAQFNSVIKTVQYLTERYDIPITDEYPNDNNLIWHGIFSHEQVDQYHPKGGRRGKKDPGKDYMKAVLYELKKFKNNEE